MFIKKKEIREGTFIKKRKFKSGGDGYKKYVSNGNTIRYLPCIQRDRNSREKKFL